jgi:hypothetical protein
MSDEHRKHIYNNFDQKETDELIGIWQANDRVEWTDEAFDVLREILQERLGEAPSQGEQVWEHIKEKPVNKNGPVLYKPGEVFWLETWINRAAIISVIATVVTGLLTLPGLHGTILSFFMSTNMYWNPVTWLLTILVFPFTIAVQCAILYFPLTALGYILKSLMEMEFNSRGEK